MRGINIIEITTDLAVDEAIEKLSKEVFSSYFKINHESLVGKVTLNSVLFYRAVPMEGNSFLPVFKGKFEIVNGKTVLLGKWTYHLYSKLILLVIFGAMIYNLISKSIELNSVPISVLLSDMGIIFITWLVFKITRKRSKEDKEWIVKYVKHVFNP